MKILRNIILAFTFVTLSACASTPETQKISYEFPELEEVSSVWERNIDGFSVIDKQSLFISNSPSKSYLIILARPNHDLRSAHAIKFDNKGRLHSGFDSLIIVSPDTSINIPTRIQRIYKIESKEQRQKIRQKIKDTKKAAENKS